MYNFPNSPTLNQVVTGVGGVQYIWDGVKWVSALAATAQGFAPSYNDTGRNVLHNPLMRVQQRGAGAFSSVVNTGVMTADRWINWVGVAGSQSVSITSLADTDRAGIGDEAAQYALRSVVTGSATTGATCIVKQGIESLRRLSGKTVIVSFWAWASSGTPKLGVSIDQSFGTGGSPSAYLSGAGQAVTLATAPARYNVSLTVPSISGKTFGINNDDAHYLNFWLSAASDQNTNSGSVGVQSGTFSLWGMQLEVASSTGQTWPSPLEKIEPRNDMANCQRFFQSGLQLNYQVSLNSGQNAQIGTNLPVTMFGKPTVTVTTNNSSNVGTLTWYTDPHWVTAATPVTATGAAIINLLFQASAEL